MSILNVTNLTDTPKDWIYNSFMSAFEQLEKELTISINYNEKCEFIDDQISELENQMENARGHELLGIIDNYLVNNDYYTVAKEWYTYK